MADDANKHQWHVHHCYELIYISGGRGKRHIGQSISYYEDGDLIFLGPNLPHHSFRAGLQKDDAFEVVIQMEKHFLGRGFFHTPEMEIVRKLLKRSRSGLAFLGETKQKAGQLLESMVEMAPFRRLITLLEVLNLIARSEEYIDFNGRGISLEVKTMDHERTDAIYQFVQNRFQLPISLEEAAREVNMAVPSFCRYFKKMTNRTFTNFVNEFRVSYACKLLNDENYNISSISQDCGFNNLSHFNKKFREFTGQSPSDYRKSRVKLIRPPISNEER